MKLGNKQISLLWSLSQRKLGWIDHPFGCGWVWDTQSGTRKVLETLVKRGLVEKTEYVSTDTFGEEKSYPQYLLSSKGQAFLLGRQYGN